MEMYPFGDPAYGPMIDPDFAQLHMMMAPPRLGRVLHRARAQAIMTNQRLHAYEEGYSDAYRDLGGAGMCTRSL